MFLFSFVFWVFKVFVKEEMNIEFLKDFLYYLEIYERLKNVNIVCLDLSIFLMLHSIGSIV